MKSRYYIVLIVVVVVLFAAPLILFPSAPFGGADAGAEQAISDSRIRTLVYIDLDAT